MLCPRVFYYLHELFMLPERSDPTPRLHSFGALEMSGFLPSIGYNTLLLDGEYTREGQSQWSQRVNVVIGKPTTTMRQCNKLQI